MNQIHPLIVFLVILPLIAFPIALVSGLIIIINNRIKRTATITITIPKELYQFYSSESKRHKFSMSKTITYALTNSYLDHMNDEKRKANFEAEVLEYMRPESRFQDYWYRHYHGNDLPSSVNYSSKSRSSKNYRHNNTGISLKHILITIFTICLLIYAFYVHSSPDTIRPAPPSIPASQFLPSYAPEPILAIHWPGHGVVEYSSDDDRLSKFTVNTSDQGVFYYLLLKELNTGDTISIYLDRNSSFTLDIPLGSYVLFYAFGNHWFGNEILFGPTSRAFKVNEHFHFNSNDEGINTYSFTFGSLVGNTPVSQVDMSELRN